MVDPAPQEPWLPLTAREDPQRAAEFEMLREGIPPWIRETVDEWIRETVGRRDGYRSLLDWHAETLTRVQTALRREVPTQVADLSDGDRLDVVDFLLREEDICGPGDIDDLEALLSEGRSVYRASRTGLERRVDPILQAIASSVHETGTRPATHLRDAWRKAWGSHPDAPGAYREAVRAVEAAYAPIVLPGDDGATLGTIIAAVRDEPAGFAVRLHGRGPGESVASVGAALDLLWTSQLDRRGAATKGTPLDVTLEQAQDAFWLATALVHLAEHGGFAVDARSVPAPKRTARGV